MPHGYTDPVSCRFYGDVMLEKLQSFGQVPKREVAMPTTMLGECKQAMAQAPNPTVPPPVDVLVGRWHIAQTTQIPLRRIVAFLCLTGIMALGYWWGETLQPVDMVRAQLRSIEDGEYGQAYGYLSARAKEQVSYDEFVALIQGNTVVMEPRDSTFQSRHVNGSTATIRGVLEGYGGYVSDVGYVLVKDVDQWRIASFEWSAPRSLKEDTSHPE